MKLINGVYYGIIRQHYDSDATCSTRGVAWYQKGAHNNKNITDVPKSINKTVNVYTKTTTISF